MSDLKPLLNAVSALRNLEMSATLVRDTVSLLQPPVIPSSSREQLILLANSLDEVRFLLRRQLRILENEVKAELERAPYSSGLPDYG